MFKSNKLAILAALLSLMMLFSAFAVPAFAEDATTAEETTAAETVEETEAGSSEETESGSETAAESSTEKGTEASTTTSATTKEETTTEDKAAAEAKKQQKTRGIINLCVGAAILVALAVLVIVYRAKIPTWWKGLKSECGKITWCPKEKLKKNNIVVVIIILVIAAAIGVLDFVFSRGMILLGDLFK